MGAGGAGAAISIPELPNTGYLLQGSRVEVQKLIDEINARATDP
jgi:hypothetical protein